jgi:hypothetical protein
MKKINMLSKDFSHDINSCPNQKIEFFEWDFFSKKNNISFYIDSDAQYGIEDKNDGKLKFLWLLESPYFNNGSFQYVLNNLENVLETYENIFTYNDELLKLNSKFKWVPAMGSWIKSPQIHKKTKKISMIVSHKSYTPQQKFRLQFAQEHEKIIDLYGRAFKEIEKKEDGLNDYMFSICIENVSVDTYFTEKILDCFCTGTIPIYLGTKKIINHFEEKGIIFLDEFNLEKLNFEFYSSKFDFVKENFERVKEFMIPENYLYSKYLKEYF